MSDNKALADRLSVDALAQAIREVDGRHDLGAGALAEALLPRIAALSSPQADKARGEGVTYRWDHVETDRRKEAFNAWVRTQANKKGFRLLSPGAQGAVHGMLRTCFYAGSNWQRRHGARTTPQPQGGASGQVSGGGEVLLDAICEAVAFDEHGQQVASIPSHVRSRIANAIAALSPTQVRPDGGEAACFRVRGGAWEDGEPSDFMREYAKHEGLGLELAYTPPAPAPDVALWKIEPEGDTCLVEHPRWGRHVFHAPFTAAQEQKNEK